MALRNLYSDSMFKHYSLSLQRRHFELDCVPYIERGKGLDVIPSILSKTIEEPVLTHVHLGINDILSGCSVNRMMEKYMRTTSAILETHNDTHITYNQVVQISSNKYLDCHDQRNDVEWIAQINDVISQVNEKLSNYCDTHPRLHFIDLGFPNNDDDSIDE